ncbi:MAG: MFS transporter [Deltaproteobacteria bacterium]|nr:MFS transporter [Deltaproteobacteria bacterium]
MNSTIQYPRFRWFALITMVVGVVAQSIIMIAPAPLIGEVAKYLGRELGMVTFTVMGLWTVTVCLGGIAGGAIVDKVGVAKVYFVCSIFLIVSAVFIPFAGKNLGAIILLRLIGGAATGPILTTISRLTAEWFPSEQRPIITGFQGMAFALGVLIGFGLAPAVYTSTESWPMTMVYMAVPAGIFLILSLVMVFGPKAPEVILEEHEDRQAGDRDFKLALKDPVIYLMVAYVFLFNWLTQAVNDLTPGYFALAAPVGVGFGITVAGQLMMMFLAMYMIGSLVSGWLNRYVYRRSTRLQVMFAFILSGIYFFVKFSGVTGSGPNPLLLVIMAITAFFMGQGIPTIMGFIAKNYPEHITGRVGGMSMGLGLIGGVVGIGFGSSALTKTGTYHASILIVTIVAVIGFVVAWWLRKPGIFEQSMSDEQAGEGPGSA